MSALSRFFTRLRNSSRPIRRNDSPKRQRLLAAEPLESRLLLAGLISHWSFSEGSGTTISDATASANNGVLGGGLAENSPAWTSTSTTRLAPSYLKYDGSNDFITVPDSASLRPTAGVTVEGWWRFAAVQDGSLLSKPLGAADQDSYTIAYQNGSLKASIDKDPDLVAFPWTPKVNQWYYVAFTCDNSTQAYNLFIDGKSVATAKSVASLQYDEHPLLIGADEDSGNKSLYFNGGIDEINLWDHALTPTEIASSYANKAPTISFANPVSSINENTPVPIAGTKVATITVTDDAFGLNQLSLSGPDAASFVIVNTDLRLVGGTSLDFETKKSYSVNVDVDDLSYGAIKENSKTFVLTVNDVGQVVATVTKNAAGNIVIADSVGKNDSYVISRKGANFVLKNIGSPQEGQISVTNITGAVLDVTKQVLSIPLATIQATGKPLLINTGLGDDLVKLDANSSFSNSPIPTTGLSIGLGAGTDTFALANDPTNNVWTITGLQSGSLALGTLGTVTFSGLENAEGGDARDVFKLTNTGANGIVKLDGVRFGTEPDELQISRDCSYTLSDTTLAVSAQVVGQSNQVFTLANIELAKITAGNSGTFIDASKFNGSVVLQGGNGNDILWGGSGNDTIYGGNGHDWLSGNGGDDTLYGSAGRDVLVGGTGFDVLNSLDVPASDSGDDILIAGTTSYDTNQAANIAIVLAWQGTATYANRITLIKTTGVGSTKQYKLNASTVTTDSVIDILVGGNALDWYFAHLAADNTDQHDAAKNEQVVGI